MPDRIVLLKFEKKAQKDFEIIQKQRALLGLLIPILSKLFLDYSNKSNKFKMLKKNRRVKEKFYSRRITAKDRLKYQVETANSEIGNVCKPVVIITIYSIRGHD